MASTVYYNRGIFHVAVHIEAIRNALKAKGAGASLTGEDVKNGFEKVKGVTLDGLMPPLEITPTDHEGGGWVQIFTVKGGKLTKASEWFRAYPEILKKHIEADAKKS